MPPLPPKVMWVCVSKRERGSRLGVFSEKKKDRHGCDKKRGATWGKGITVIFHLHSFFPSCQAKKRADLFCCPITPPEISSPPHYYYYYFDKEERRWWWMRIVGAKAWTLILGLKPHLLMGMRLRRSKWLGRSQNRWSH